MNKAHEKEHSISIQSVRFAITVAAALSFLLIAAGIWNAVNSAQTAELNIKMIVKARELSSSLKSNQDAMSTSIEMAIGSGDARWQSNFENSHTTLLEVIENTSKLVDDPIMDDIDRALSKVVNLERTLFENLAAGNQLGAFEILASDKYQELKIEQEQFAFTLRSILDQKAQQLIKNLRKRLSKTIIVLSAQTILMVAVWLLTINTIKRWHHANHQHKQELTKLAHYDSLTGIGNRSLFQTKLHDAFQSAETENKTVGLFLMDLDHFKSINDNLGHAIGDKLLIRVAEELSGICSQGDTVVRLGGDEFAIILQGFDDRSETIVTARKILDIFRDPLLIEKHEISTGTSLGVAFYPQDAKTDDALLRKADMALYEAKRNGRGHIQFFDAEIETKARYKSELLEDLSLALEKGELHLTYQPIMNLKSERIAGVETLLRWTHPKRGSVSPAEFIPLAEESRLIIPIGKWVLEEACKQQAEWARRGLPDIHMAVNLSAVQFEEQDITQSISAIIEESKIDREKLTLEITESTIMENGDNVTKKLRELRSIGINLAIDDFGTGYSSLAYLKRFPIQNLKVDRAFVQELPGNQQDVAITRSIIKMAHELGLTVVAEGIENLDQLKFLKDVGCNFGQGFYFGIPTDEHQAFNMLLKDKRCSSKITRIA